MKRQQEEEVGRGRLYRYRVLVSDLIRERKRAVVAVERGSLAASGKGLSVEILRGKEDQTRGSGHSGPEGMARARSVVLSPNLILAIEIAH